MGIETLAIASLAGTAASGVLGFAGAQAEGKAAKQMAWYKAGVAHQNAEIAKKNAEQALLTGEVRSTIEREQTGGKVGAARAIQAGSGLDVSVGSLVDVRNSIQTLGDLDARVIAYNAARESLGYRQQAANFESEAQMAMMGGKASQQAAEIKSYGSILGTATSFADKWMGFQRTRGGI